VEFVVYVPIAVVERSTIVGFNFMADTLMYCGAVLLLASAMPRNVRLDARQIVPSISQGHDHHAFTS
jgi:phosphate starvation-inducible membrane PsiE